MSTVNSDRQSFWQRTLRGWDAGFAVLLALSAVTMLISGYSRSDRIVVGALLTALVLAYLTLARPGALRGDSRRTRCYLVVLVVVLPICTAINPLGSILLFLAFAQLWYFADGLRIGLIGSALMTVAVAVANVWRVRPEGIEIAQLAGQHLVGLGFSIALGLWLTRVAEENEVLAELIAEVERTQAQSAIAQHQAGVLAERERVAGQVHDTLAQGFTSIVLLAQTGQGQLSSGDATGGATTAEDLEHLARTHLAEARALVAAFGTAALDDGGLSEALGRLLSRFRGETGIDVTVATPAEPISRDTEVVLLRGVQEALVAARSGGPTQLALGADGAVRPAVSS